MKKLLFKIASIIFIAVLLFSTSCAAELSQIPKDKLIKAALAEDLSSGVYTFSFDGKTLSVDGTLKVYMRKELYVDGYFMLKSTLEGSGDDSSVISVYVRDSGVYALYDNIAGGFGFIKTASKDYVKQIDDYIKDGKGEIRYLAEPEEIIDVVCRVFGFANHLPEILKKYLLSALKIVHVYAKTYDVLSFGEVNEVYRGEYRLNVNVIEYITKMLESLVEIGKIVDQNPKLSLDDLLTVDAADLILNPLFNGLTAQDVRLCLEILLDLLDSDFVLPQVDNKSSEAYIKKLLQTKVNGFSIGAQRVSDILDLVKDDKTQSFECYLDNFGKIVLDTVTAFTNSLNVVYYFDLDLYVTRISVDAYLKKSVILPDDEISDYKNMRVKIDFRPKEVFATLAKID